MAKDVKKVEKAEEVTSEVTVNIVEKVEAAPVMSAATLAELEAGKKALAKQANNK